MTCTSNVFWKIAERKHAKVLAFFGFSLNDMSVSDNPNEIAGKGKGGACRL
jgi:hypothetical protein